MLKLCDCEIEAHESEHKLGECPNRATARIVAWGCAAYLCRPCAALFRVGAAGKITSDVSHFAGWTVNPSTAEVKPNGTL